MAWLDLDAERPLVLDITVDASVGRGVREFIAGETPRLRATVRAPRTGVPFTAGVDSITLVHLTRRATTPVVVMEDEAFVAAGDGLWTLLVEPLAVGTYDLLATLVADDIVVSATDTLVVRDP